MERNQTPDGDSADRSLRTLYTVPATHDRFLDYFALAVRADFDPATEALQALER